MYEKYIIPKETLSHVKSVGHIQSSSVQVYLEGLERKFFSECYV